MFIPPRLLELLQRGLHVFVTCPCASLRTGRRTPTSSVMCNARVVQWWKISNSMMMMGIGTPSSQSKISRPTASSYVIFSNN